MYNKSEMNKILLTKQLIQNIQKKKKKKKKKKKTNNNNYILYFLF